MSGTFLALSGRMLWRVLERRDVDPVFVFREAGLDPTLMKNPRARYSLERVATAVTLAVELTDDPCLGLELAEYWRPTDHHALGYAFCASSTLRSALQRFVRYFGVLNDSLRFELHEDGEQVTMSVSLLDGYPAIPLPAAEDARWALLVTMCRYISGDTFDPIEVGITHPEPACRARFFGFFRCPVQFGAAESCMVFKRSDLDRPLPAANHELAISNDHILSAFLAELTEDDLVTRVRTALAEALPNGNPSDEIVAKAVCSSPRTLQRRLAEQGTSVSQLLAEVRRDLAEKYIIDPALTLNEVGFLLGFSELSSFSRAFKRWTGQSPKHYRDTVT